MWNVRCDIILFILIQIGTDLSLALLTIIIHLSCNFVLFCIILNQIIWYSIALYRIMLHQFTQLYSTTFFSFSLFFLGIWCLSCVIFLSSVVYTKSRLFGATCWIELSRKLNKNNWESHISQESSTIKSIRQSDKKNPR